MMYDVSSDAFFSIPEVSRMSPGPEVACIKGLQSDTRFQGILKTSEPTAIAQLKNSIA